VAIGTDAGSIGVLHGESLAEELKLFVQAGYSLSEAISCATHQGAKLLGVDREFGLLAKGRPAHFLAVRGTPAQLLRKLRFLEAVYLNGKPCEQYRILLRKARVHRP
jgi:imidazolonepropionase-like amidohydrolase